MMNEHETSATAGLSAERLAKRIAEIRQRANHAYQPQPFGLRTSLDLALIDNIELLAAYDALQADNDRARARAAALEARLAQALGVARAVAEAENDINTQLMRAAAQAAAPGTDTNLLFANRSALVFFGVAVAGRIREQARAVLAAAQAAMQVGGSEVERLREIAEAVATEDVLAYESDAGDEIRCPFCNGDRSWPRDRAPDAQRHPIDGWFVHEPSCIVLKARAVLAAAASEEARDE